MAIISCGLMAERISGADSRQSLWTYKDGERDVESAGCLGCCVCLRLRGASLAAKPGRGDGELGMRVRRRTYIVVRDVDLLNHLGGVSKPVWACVNSKTGRTEVSLELFFRWGGKKNRQPHLGQ